MIDKELFCKKTPDLLVGLAQIAADVAKENLGIDEDLADEFGYYLAQEMAQQWRGANAYIPLNIEFKNSQRDYEIFKKFNGSNHNDLAREFGISKVWVYKIIKKVRKEKQDKQQPCLFD